MGRDGRRGWHRSLAVALVGAFPVAEFLLPAIFLSSRLGLIWAVGVVSVPWVVIGARPAVATAVFLLAFWLPLGIGNLVGGFPDIEADVPLFIVILLAAFAVWRLHRQSARVSTPDKVN